MKPRVSRLLTEIMNDGWVYEYVCCEKCDDIFGAREDYAEALRDAKKNGTPTLCFVCKASDPDAREIAIEVTPHQIKIKESSDDTHL